MYSNFKTSLKSLFLGIISLLFSAFLFAQNINIPTATVCSGTKASLTATTGLSNPIFKWYSDASLSTFLYTGATYTTAPLSTTTTYYVTVQNATTLPNTTNPKTVTVTVNPNCGSTALSGCAATGSLLYLDDFGGDNASAPNIGPKLSAGQTTLSYVGNINSGNPGNGEYTITKGWGSSPPFPGAWQSKIDDHTYASDLSRGYFMCVNASTNPDKFYDHIITGICPNTSQLYFSIWAANLLRSDASNPDDPSFRFEISDPSTATVLTNFTTGKLPRQTNNNITWGNYGFSFPVPTGVTSVELKIYNNTNGGNGNDFALDDIAIYGCFPPVIIPTVDGASTPYCANSPMTLTTSFANDGSLGTNLAYQWYYSPTQNDTSWNTWTPIAGATLSSYTNTSPQAGYYRVVVGDPANISARNFNCVTASPASAVNVQTCAVLPLTLLSFSGSHSGDDNILNWTTTSEINVRNHIVEYSTDAVNFIPIATISATGNDLSGNQNYQYIHRNVEGTMWYRLKSIDLDGNYSYSNVVMITSVQNKVQACLTGNSIFPAPFTTTLHLNLSSCKMTNAILKLINTAGVIVKEEKVLLSQGTSTYNLSNLGSLAAGVYMVKISTENESVIMKTIKQ